MPDLTGKVALVTGGNAGIGYSTVEQLAAHGAKVYMAARSEAKASEAIAKIRSAHPEIKDGAITWVQLDLSSPASVVAAAEKVKGLEERLDILINNAGLGPSPFKRNESGIEMLFATNHIGHFILADRLLPLMKKTAEDPTSDVRIVTVSSMAHAHTPANTTFATATALSNPCGLEADGLFAGFKRYGVSKLANILFASELQRRLDAEPPTTGNPIISISLHPGGVATDSGMGVFPNFCKPVLRMLMATPLQGATTQLFAATAKEVRAAKEVYGGKYLMPYGKVTRPSKMGMDEKMAGELWKASEEVVQRVCEGL
ncbi:short-chain dehydrogenase [Lepidopterella palustris CBS 459.81]|uniref:Short-chain dehydrogenase n=1 Tax=Lepidopterella palustris CBS 459.81 TaxID=1314670 RepID=A0A8E2DWE3_9PEZI|nr:short-chain dehydrogenase [Lepidopterella palustris CBS 459.81]